MYIKGAVLDTYVLGTFWRWDMSGVEGLLLSTKEEKALDLSEMAAATKSKDFSMFLLTSLSSILC